MSANDVELAALAQFTPTEWSLELRQGLDCWKQGHLVRDMPLAWAALPGVDVVTNLDSGPSENPRLIVQPDADLSWAIATSQTCDIAATGPGALHAFVQVSPVVTVDGMNQQKLESISRGEVVYLTLLRPPRLEGTYVADLRISIPVSKSVLAGCEPEEAFDDEAGYLAFARQLALKAERPALHDFLSRDVRTLIRNRIAASRKSKDTSWWQQVHEVRVQARPTRLEPQQAELIVVGRSILTPAEKNEWKVLGDTIRKASKAHGIEFRHPLHVTTTTLLAFQCRASTRLDIPELRTTPDRL